MFRITALLSFLMITGCASTAPTTTTDDPLVTTTNSAPDWVGDNMVAAKRELRAGRYCETGVFNKSRLDGRDMKPEVRAVLPQEMAKLDAFGRIMRRAHEVQSTTGGPIQISGIKLEKTWENHNRTIFHRWCVDAKAFMPVAGWIIKQ